MIYYIIFCYSLYKKNCRIIRYICRTSSSPPLGAELHQSAKGPRARLLLTKAANHSSSQCVPNRPWMYAEIVAWMYHGCYDDVLSLGSPTARRGATHNDEQLSHPLYPGTPC